MGTITFLKRASLLTLMIAAPLFFYQCGGSDEEGASSEKADTASFNEEEAMYPAEKVQENTNLTDDEPLEMGKPFWSIDKSILLATLNKHKTEIQYKIEELESSPVSGAGTGASQASPQELKSYVEQLDEAITNVRMASEANFPQVAESAQEVIQTIGGKLVSSYLRIERGF